jgi:hypothetical protein
MAEVIAPIESILTSIKKLLGIAEADTSFDTDIIMDINSAIMALQQLGVGPTTGFYISSSADLWTDLLDDRIDLEAAKIYIYHKVRLVFDPPQNSFLVDSIKNQITELEFRINVQAEGGA